MQPSKLSVPLSVVMVASLLLASCAPVRVNSYVARDLDLRRYHTYAWAATDTFSTGDPRLDNNTFFVERVQRAVDGHLRQKGFEKVGSGQPDFVVHYHARVEQRLDSKELRPGEPGCQADDCRPFVYDAGTLLIDLVDRRSNQLMWRGWAERGLQGVVDDQTWMDQTVDDAVRRIMARFPS
jgi:uncharacterized protein DUF4136